MFFLLFYLTPSREDAKLWAQNNIPLLVFFIAVKHALLVIELLGSLGQGESNNLLTTDGKLSFLAKRKEKEVVR